ncbi:MAG TPA: hypothetical protein VFO52_05835 [Longimicrobiales bacterium]|nr:hypothetical protein [Longimicrobiales bacterium]
MHGFTEDEPHPAGSLMPPATTQRRYARPPAQSSEPRIVPPFVARPTIETEAPAPNAPEAIEPVNPFEPFQPVEPIEAPSLPTPWTSAPVAEAAPEPEPLEDIVPTEETEDTRWEAMSSDEGVVEPAFEADTDAVLEALTQQAAELARKDEFPLEAFIVPEKTQRVPTGFEPKNATDKAQHTPLTSLAERLEKLSHRLRIEDSDSVVRRLAGGDRLDALLAGLLAGYLAGRSEQQ